MNEESSLRTGLFLPSQQLGLIRMVDDPFGNRIELIEPHAK
jgi:hypothetical protein